MVPHIITETAVTVFTDGKVRTVAKDDARYHELVGLLSRGERLEIEEILDRPLAQLKELEQFNHAGIHMEIKHGLLYVNGMVNTSELAEKITEFARRGLPATHLMRFMGNIMKNPSYQARAQLFGWIAQYNMPVTGDGQFLAFKVVKADLWDIKTGNTFFHAVGEVLQMDRGEVDDNPSNQCSRGIHCCAEDYIGSYGSNRRSDDVVCLLKVNPANVVCLPYERSSKMRVCEATVFAHLSREEASKYFEGQSRITFDDDSCVYEDDEGEDNLGYYED